MSDSLEKVWKSLERQQNKEALEDEMDALSVMPVAKPKRERKKPDKAPPLFTIAVDSREQDRLDFDPWLPLGLFTVQFPVTLQSGDYSVIGSHDKCAIERKSAADASASFTRERERFTACLERLEKIHHAPGGYAALVIEAGWAEILAGQEQSMVSGKSVIGSALSASVEYGLPVFFCDDRRIAAACVVKLLSKFWKYNIGRPNRVKGWSKL